MNGHDRFSEPYSVKMPWYSQNPMSSRTCITYKLLSTQLAETCIDIGALLILQLTKLM